MAESVVEGLRAEVKELRKQQGATAVADARKLSDKADQIKAGELRRERNILQGKMPDADEPKAAPTPAPAPAAKDDK